MAGLAGTWNPSGSNLQDSKFFAGIEMVVILDSLTDSLPLFWLSRELGCYIKSISNILGVFKEDLGVGFMVKGALMASNIIPVLQLPLFLSAGTLLAVGLSTILALGVLEESDQ